MSADDLGQAVLYLYLLAMALFVGGQLRAPAIFPMWTTTRGMKRPLKPGGPMAERSFQTVYCRAADCSGPVRARQ